MAKGFSSPLAKVGLVLVCIASAVSLAAHKASKVDALASLDQIRTLRDIAQVRDSNASQAIYLADNGRLTVGLYRAAVQDVVARCNQNEAVVTEFHNACSSARVALAAVE